MTTAFMRGWYYPSVYSVRCPQFQACNVCGGCTHYNAHQVWCQWCERGHKQAFICLHGEKQRRNAALVTERLKRPLFHPDTPAGTVKVADVEHHEDLVRMLEEKGALMMDGGTGSS